MFPTKGFHLIISTGGSCEVLTTIRNLKLFFKKYHIWYPEYLYHYSDDTPLIELDEKVIHLLREDLNKTKYFHVFKF